ncbi:DUF927 domain-containing protein [Enterobacter hormaechei]|uniref:DUF927 domain-containing protein n=1 Tax=Enterobacter hormaechei TaxID=158836 RepID=UPI00294A114D|nr:DUF927 domain-containing protein [Enterobacter hormaechei]MDV5433780.1 DUF927 domain-containing protein [Enterobacter hormaechei]
MSTNNVIDLSVHKDNPPAEKLPPFYWVHREYDRERGDAGVYFYRAPTEKNPNPAPVCISDVIEVTAETRDNDNESWGKLLSWCDRDGMPKKWAMPATSLYANGGAEAISILVNGGLRIWDEKAFIRYLKGQSHQNRLTCVTRCGWFKPAVYVTPVRTFNPIDKDMVVYQVNARVKPEPSCGTLATWRDEVAALCVGNSRLVLAVSTAFLSPMLTMLGVDGFCFHYVGASSSGKSRSMTVAASVLSDPKEYIRSWRATDNGLEGIAARHNDGLLCLDEIAQVDASKAGEIAYMLPNGKGKQRSTKNGTAKEIQQWCLALLSNGEIDLKSHADSVRKSTYAGQEMRVINIPADNCEFACFEHLHGEANGALFADLLDKAVRENHGTAFNAWLDHLTINYDTIKEGWRDFKSAFLNSVAEDPSGQIGRVAEKFAIAAYAGELSSEITGWSPGTATEAAKVCFTAWIERRGGTESHEDNEIVERIRQTIVRDGARFQDANKPDEIPTARVGFIKDDEYIIPVEGWKVIFAGLDAKRAASVLQAKGITKPDRRYLPGLGRVRCYIIHRDSLAD